MSELESNTTLTLTTESTIPIRLVDLRQVINDPSSEELSDNQATFFCWKYRFDPVAASVLIVVFSPLMLLLCLLVKLTSRGPVLYRQTRVGLNGELFEIFKLRSMFNDAEKEGKAIWCIKNDPRITWFGRILRKVHLDELPQLFNIARGDMVFVGPRPERPEICEKLSKVIDSYYERVIVKPGVTGLAQINLPPDEYVEDAMRKQILDLCYIDQAGFWLDARMLMATALRMLGIKGETVMKLMRVCRRDLVVGLSFGDADVTSGWQEGDDETAPWADAESEDTPFELARMGGDTNGHDSGRADLASMRSDSSMIAAPNRLVI